ncbi:NAD(P)/FAD-dependent oxidoreductase [Paraburkholderia sp. EG286B]|uniref:NAD(P)/FAD-dependent oxidoreductase n=1 Tax=Paraburkholderia sp. EG286B TaxID=3237011 RepID=UPI0034D3466F
MHRIVIVGGGAGGLELATRLGNQSGRRGRVDVTLVDRCATHIWKPLLHEAAAGSLDINAHEISYAAHSHWNNFRFVLGELVGLDRRNRSITIAPVLEESGNAVELLPARELTYDSLVLALGSQTNFFDVPGAHENAFPLDTLEQAERLRKRLIQLCLLKNSDRRPENDEAVQIAIIGAGATGVELAAELRRMEQTLRQFGIASSRPGAAMRITLIERGSRVLPVLPQRVSERSRLALELKDICVKAATPVTSVQADGVTVADGSLIPADVTVWAAGIKAPAVLATLDGLAVNRINQVKVTSSLQSESDTKIFAIGDCAACSGDLVVPPRAQAAHQQAMFLSKALAALTENRPLGSFVYKDYGSLVSLGSLTAVGSIAAITKIRPLAVEGLVAELLYAVLYRKHLVAVSGLRRTILATVAHMLRRQLNPRIKLH